MNNQYHIMSTDKYSLFPRGKVLIWGCIGFSGGVFPKQHQSESLIEEKSPMVKHGYTTAQLDCFLQ